MINILKNIADKETLQQNLTFASMFIAVYEHMTDYVVSYIRDFLCDIGVENGKMRCRKTVSYRRKIQQRVVDNNGNKDPLKASFLWLVDNDAISKSNYSKFLEIKAVRNKYAHELSNVMYHGITEQEVTLFFDMYELYQKISRWFFINIDAEIMGYDFPEDADLDSVKTITDLLFGMALDVLYNGKSEEYKSIIAQFEKKQNEREGQ